VLLTRSPLGATRCCHQVVLARLACIKHAASVHPEPGSNSPSEIVNSLGARRPVGGCSRWSSVTLEPPSLTIRPGRTGGMGDTGDQPCTAQGSSVIRMRQGTVPRGQAPEGRGFGTGFSHTVEFSRNVAGMLFGDSPAVPVSCHRRSGTTGLSRSSKTSHLPGQRTPGGAPPATSTPSHRSAALRPDLLGVRTATEQPSDRILLAFGDPLSSDADATGVVRRGPRSRRTSLLAAWRR
jgi:hypothetical protein